MIILMNADESIAFRNAIDEITPSLPSPSFVDENEKNAFVLREVCPALEGLTAGGAFPILAVKLGSAGAAVVAGGKTAVVPTAKVEARDTVGAGDAFCAAFILAWIRGRTAPECAALGNRVAAEVLAVPGTGIGRERLAPLRGLFGQVGE